MILRGFGHGYGGMCAIKHIEHLTDSCDQITPWHFARAQTDLGKREQETEGDLLRKSYNSILYTSPLNSRYQGSRSTTTPAPRNPSPSLHSTRTRRRDYPQSIRIALSPSF